MFGWRLYCKHGFAACEIGFMTEQDAIEDVCDRVATLDWPGYYTHADITRAGVVVTTVREGLPGNA